MAKSFKYLLILISLLIILALMAACRTNKIQTHTDKITTTAVTLTADSTQRTAHNITTKDSTYLSIDSLWIDLIPLMRDTLAQKASTASEQLALRRIRLTGLRYNHVGALAYSDSTDTQTKAQHTTTTANRESRTEKPPDTDNYSPIARGLIAIAILGAIAYSLYQLNKHDT